MSYSLAAAAGACGVNKSTILRAIRAGKISAAKDEHGEWHVEPVELHRVYPPASERTGATQRYAVVDASAVAAEAHQRAALAVEVAMLREQLADSGLRFSGTSPDGRLVEIAEIAGHPFMLGSQFHPELKSRPNRPHPLFRDFVGAAAELAGEQLSLEAVTEVGSLAAH